MSETQQTEDDNSEKNSDQNAKQLEHLTLNENNKVLEQSKCTPTLDYLQVP